MKSLALIVNHIDFFFSHRVYIAEMAKKHFGCHVIVIAEGAGDDPRLKEAGYEGIEWQVGRGQGSFSRELGALRRLGQIINKRRPDIIHAVALKAILYTALQCWIFPRKRRIPTIFAFTGLGYLFGAGAKEKAFIRHCVETCLKITLNRKRTRCLFQNTADHDEFIEKGIIRADRACVIKGSGVNTDLFSPATEAVREENAPLRVLLPARMLKEKGVELFVRAGAILKQRLDMPLAFLLCGPLYPDNPKALSEDQIRQWEKMGHCRWLGKVDDMAELYRHVDIVCLPTTYREGVPRALIEAASSALPIITTDRAGCNDIVKHDQNGLLVPANDIQALIVALEKLILSPELRARMGHAGREHVLQAFSDTIITQQTADLYQEIL